jgi:hypothetical protein
MTLAGTYCLLPARPLPPGTAVRAAGSWTAGAATAAGRVRKENQDAVAIQQVGPWQIALCADGLGGLPLGGEASGLAVQAASGWLRQRLAHTSVAAPQELLDLVLSGLHEAQGALARHAEELALPPRGGLRTTLTVVVAGSSHWAFAHAGDGFGIRILPGAARVEPWLQPQKGAYLNEVACSLGPHLEGGPLSGVLEREPGELLAFGSDGIGDRVDLEGFGLHLLQRLQDNPEALSGLCGELLEELAGLSSDLGYLFDDNLSLVVLRPAHAGGGTC